MSKKKLLSSLSLLTVVLIVVAFLGYMGDSVKEYFYSVRAAVSDNVSGYAWSESVGWISFNNISSGGGTSYGVKINQTSGDFSGYAWSENVGWVSFNRSDTGNPPNTPFNGDSGAIAKYNLSTREITGWARVLANGDNWDGWIRFCDSGTANCSAANQRARIDASGNFQGWAWSDSVVGWISLNCANQGTCGSSNYKVSAVVNQAPVVTSLSVSPISDSNYCKTPAHRFSWNYSDPDGDAQSKFQLQVDNNSDFSSPEVDRTVNGVASIQQVFVTTSATADKLIYNEANYYWRVRAWDSNNLASDYVSGSSFATAKHVFPTVKFSASPATPSAGEVVQFTDLTTGEATINGWTWSISDAVYQGGTTANSQNPKVKFTSTGTKVITLAAKDADDYQCSNTDTASSIQNIKIKLALPNWKETAP